MNWYLAKRLAPFVYVIAILLAVFFGSGGTVAAVAAIGAVAIGALYSVTRTPGRDRNRNRHRGRG